MTQGTSSVCNLGSCLSALTAVACCFWGAAAVGGEPPNKSCQAGPILFCRRARRAFGCDRTRYRIDQEMLGLPSQPVAGCNLGPVNELCIALAGGLRHFGLHVLSEYAGPAGVCAGISMRPGVLRAAWL